MDRYLDNVSPDPTSMPHPSSCYKTPDYHMHSSVNMLYPTPPSDNDESLSNSAYKLSQAEFTPTLMNSHYANTNSKDEILPQPTNSVNTNSSRYRRRSRTTYSKSQVKTIPI